MPTIHPDERPMTQTIRANDLEIGYETYGSGPPVVLLHGATSSGRADFAAQIPFLAASFRVFVPDARGHGATRWDAAKGLEAAWLVDDLRAFADVLGLEMFHLVGFSMGAMTALGFAVRWPERLRTLALVGISPQREPRASVARRLMDPVRIERDDPAWAADQTRRHAPVQGDGAWQRLLPAVARDVASQPSLTPRELRAITPPTLVVCGDRDPFVPVGQAWGLARQVRDGRLLVAPDCGHQVMAHQPTLFNEALAGFHRSTGALEDAPEMDVAAAAVTVDTVATTIEEGR